ncbi:MAG: hypothetical protein L0221_19475 [Chloroflexi bacterium]|nr:hypothetical protein [Chloroflexota bacterium]
MAEKTIPASQLLPHLVEQLRRDTDLVRLVALESTLFGEAHAVALTNKENLVDRGFFKLSWKHGSTKLGAELRNDAPYGPVIEHGRRPGRPGPPLEPIQAWVNRKLVANGHVKAEEADEAARAIRDAIHFRGTKPRKVLQRTYAVMKKHFKSEAIARLRRRHGG